MTPIVTTPRLGLFMWRADDIDDAHAIWGDARVMRFVGPPHESRERTRDAITAAIEAQREHGCCLWRVVCVEDAATIGACGFQLYEGPGSRRPGARLLELAFHLRPEVWGRGFAGEAARGAIAHAQQLGATAIVALTHPDNAASARVLQKLGFADEGEEGGQRRHLLQLVRV